MCSSLGIMHVCKGGKISEREAKFPGKYAPPPPFPRKFGPRGGENFLRHRSHTGAQYEN